MGLPTIGSLWVGEALSWLEQLCLKSFLDHGHEVALFTYTTVANVPSGVRIENAKEILPSDRIIRHARTGSPAYHADVFRLHMIQKTDFVWADTDAFCCRPWQFKGRHFHGWISDNKPMVNNGVLCLPKSSKTLAAMKRFTSDEYPIPPWYSEEKQAQLKAAKEQGTGIHVSLLPWGVWGPDALTWYLKATGEIEKSKAPQVLYPVPFKKAGFPLNPNHLNSTQALIRDDTLSVHFWGRRFRSIVANRYDGLVPKGSYVHSLLKKHEIDPHETRHLMTPPKDNKRPPRNTLDFSMFDTQDVANLILQRSELTDDAQIIQDWMQGHDGPLLVYAELHRDRLLEAGYDVAVRECGFFTDATDIIAPQRIADIGCGYAFADLHLYQKYNCDITLIDIEEGDGRHFGFQETHPGYTSLGKARAFLEANGVPANKIRTINPQTDDVAKLGSFDLVLSLASCGFHYPVENYANVFKGQINAGGGIILDIRKGSRGIRALKQFGQVEVLAKHKKYSTVLTRKEARQ